MLPISTLLDELILFWWELFKCLSSLYRKIAVTIEAVKSAPILASAKGKYLALKNLTISGKENE